jgi:hypothetical protein
MQGLEDHLCIFSTYVQMINTLRHDFEATNIEKEIALINTFNDKVETLCLQNELCQP